MCGIVGLLVKKAEMRDQLGALMVPMLVGMTERGPDSAGLAVYTAPVSDRKHKLSLYSGEHAVVWPRLADELRKDGVPVTLTVQVDSIEKKGQHDGVIPANVARAVNFYQPDGVLHGRTKIRAADPAATQILGNFRFSYKDMPAECKPYPWYERKFIKTHIAIECDPVLWKRIEGLIRDSLGESPNETASR